MFVTFLPPICLIYPFTWELADGAASEPNAPLEFVPCLKLLPDVCGFWAFIAEFFSNSLTCFWYCSSYWFGSSMDVALLFCLFKFICSLTFPAAVVVLGALGIAALVRVCPSFPESSERLLNSLFKSIFFNSYLVFILSSIDFSSFLFPLYLKSSFFNFSTLSWYSFAAE